MPRKLINAYTDAGGIFLLAVAWLLLLSNLESVGLVQPRDPILSIPMRDLSCIWGVAALVLSLICLFAKSTWLKLALLLWVGASLASIQLGTYALTDHPSMSGYFGILENAFCLSGDAADSMVKMASGGLIVGSALSMLWLRASTKNTLKISCAHCGGHVQFSTKAIGSKVLCPHCGRSLTLYDSEYVKMSCIFCRRHIEFPVHSIGRKMPCPHCKMEITLKERSEDLSAHPR